MVLKAFMQFTSIASDVLKHGPLYSLARQRIKSQKPLEPVENWKYWCDSKPSWIASLMRAYPPEGMRKAYWNKMVAMDHSTGIEAHYDVSNSFYALFLDEKYRFYTCADFHSDQDSLEDAQTNKAYFIRGLLNLNGNESIADLGCGWGAMMKFLQEKGHQGNLTGFTLSKEQFDYAKNELGLNVVLSDFIADPLHGAPFDRIFSIGAIEHVRPAELDGFYCKMFKSLVPGGLAVHQFFSFSNESYPISLALLQLFFPGSLLSTHHRHLNAAQAAGFSVAHDSVHDYKPTIRAWYDRLCDKRSEALDLVGLETFNRYMTFFPIAWLFFKENEADLHRLVLSKKP